MIFIFKFRRHWTIENLLTAKNEYIYCQCALGNFDWGKIGSRRFQAQGTLDSNWLGNTIYIVLLQIQICLYFQIIKQNSNLAHCQVY